MTRRLRLAGAVILVGLVPCVLAGAVLGLGGYTFWYAEGGSYFSNDPRSCVNCHVMREHYDGWQKASHHTVAVCNDCHVPHDFVGKYLSKGLNGYHHSRAFTLQDFHEPIQITPRNAAALQAACLHCHGDFVHAIGQDVACVHCHRTVGHSQMR